jgi:hypothetical protein
LIYIVEQIELKKCAFGVLQVNPASLLFQKSMLLTTCSYGINFIVRIHCCTRSIHSTGLLLLYMP